MITTSTATSSANTSKTPVPTVGDDVAAGASDFDSFLKLLTAQLRNQDPLSPLDSTQFVEQLATFSAVEQQIKTNDLLEQMVSGANGLGLTEATSWIGKEVETPTDTTDFRGEPLRFSIPIDRSADVTEFVVQNHSGQLVFSSTLAGTDEEFVWNGEGVDGVTVPQGLYSVSVNRFNAGELVSTRSPNTISIVREARLEGATVKLALENGAIVDPEHVAAVREVRQSTSTDGAS